MDTMFTTSLFCTQESIHLFTPHQSIIVFSGYSIPGHVLPAGEVMRNSNKECSGQGKHIDNMYTTRQALLFQRTSTMKKSEAGSEEGEGQGEGF